MSDTYNGIERPMGFEQFTRFSNLDTSRSAVRLAADSGIECPISDNRLDPFSRVFSQAYHV